MKLLKKVLNWLDDRKNFIVLLNVLGLFLVAFLLYKTSSLWQNLIDLFIIVLKPLFVAFVISYVFEPFIEKMIKIGLSRPLAIIILVSLLLLVCGLLIGSLIPMLYSKVSDLITPLSQGMREIQKMLYEHFNLDISQIVIEMTSALQQWIMDFSFMNTTLGIITNVLGKIGSYIINLILAIYFLADYPRIRKAIKNMAMRISSNFTFCLKEINQQLTAYIQAFLILMVIQATIYCTIYLLIGHSSWLLLGLLSGLSCVFPYIGPMSVNVLGVLTALGLPTSRIILLILAIFIQSNIDSYLITPKVYSSKIQIEPVYVIFSLLTASTILGPWGIVIAMPTLVIIKISIQTIKSLKNAKQDISQN